MHAGHGHTSTMITHHADGSATIKHHHEDGVHEEYGVADLDGVHDGLEDHLRSPEEIEAHLKARGIDPEALEEAIEPGLHDKALDYLADKDKVNPDDIEEKVSPGVHERMVRLIKK
jgi:hypothetical protein